MKHKEDENVSKENSEASVLHIVLMLPLLMLFLYFFVVPVLVSAAGYAIKYAVFGGIIALVAVPYSILSFFFQADE